MIKRILMMATAFVLITAMGLSGFSGSFYAQGATASEDLESLQIYKAVGYKAGDCVLTANVYMLRRASILAGSLEWDEITNTTLRSTACTSPYGSSLRYSYTYKKDGLTFKVIHDVVTGSAGNKTAQLKKLLEKHPEGIVVRGRDVRGYGHGILITEYRNGTFYAADSAQNKGGANRGILKMKETTVPRVSSLVHIWYIDSISGSSKSAKTHLKNNKDAEKENLENIADNQGNDEAVENANEYSDDLGNVNKVIAPITPAPEDEGDLGRAK